MQSIPPVCCLDIITSQLDVNTFEVYSQALKGYAKLVMPSFLLAILLSREISSEAIEETITNVKRGRYCFIFCDKFCSGELGKP